MPWACSAGRKHGDSNPCHHQVTAQQPLALLLWAGPEPCRLPVFPRGLRVVPAFSAVLPKVLPPGLVCRRRMSSHSARAPMVEAYCV